MTDRRTLLLPFAAKLQHPALTIYQYRDLERCVRIVRATVGTVECPDGEAVALRTGGALLRRGLVEAAGFGQVNGNTLRLWRPTKKGLDWIRGAEQFTPNLLP
jgi:hypothetical protein